MISIQVSVQHPTTMIQAHIKLGVPRSCGSTSVSTPSAQPNMPLTDYLSPTESMGKLPPLVDPLMSTFALEQRLLALRSLKRSSCSDTDDCFFPPSKRSRRTSATTSLIEFPSILDFSSSSSSSTSSPPAPTKKSVRFASQEPTDIISQNDDNYDCEARWYSRAEYNAFRQDMRQNFFMHSMYMRRNSLPRTQYDSIPRPPKDLCIRGLEKFCFHDVVGKDARKLRLQAVLDQQGVQQALGNDDPMAIRVVAELHSQKVCQQALARAADDFRAVLYGWSRKSI
ncbi:expressed unknown protein [Seminavis robusta]|uniref:Uncharacterized protein n=1 Tax=Seminavis robusta TaxID=568900 RepID=A0A9N8EQ69_9STRA|nr:expressed unknown protein [Seminavis robusta]|eukprot:Sro1653_g288870.1 n/a (283) ;mRNA; r:21424-22272